MQIDQISSLICRRCSVVEGEFAEGHLVVACKAPKLGEPAADGDSLNAGAGFRVPQR